MISKIDTFCGIDELVDFLYQYKKPLNRSGNLIFLTMIQYYQALYLYKVSVEDDMLIYRENAIDTLNLLKQCQDNKGNNKYLSFLVGLIAFRLEATSAVKKLA